jgi:hypothetical protein
LHGFDFERRLYSFLARRRRFAPAIACVSSTAIGLRAVRELS